MLEVWTSRNRVISNGLLTTYSRTRDNSMLMPFYEYRRIRTKSYAYVGLSEEAAKNCAEDMVRKYTRTMKKWQWSNNKWEIVPDADGEYEVLVADVQIVHDEGSLWHVQVNVNEESIIYLMDESTNLEAAFDYYCGIFDYDED